MRIGSLFSGIGGLELGLEWAGVGHTVWQVEIDPFCRSVLAKHWPDAQRFDDVRTVGRHNLPPVDVICGGFPCQDISYANPNGQGLDGARSGLWYEYARIIGEVAPAYVVVENVRALLTRGMGAVLGTLADLGYDAEWDVVSARSVGASHLRERVFIIAFGVANSERGGRGGESRRRAGTLLENGHLEVEAGAGRRVVGPDPDNARLEGHRNRVRDGQEGRQEQNGHPGQGGGEWWATEPSVGRVAYGVPERVDKLRALGNAVVPQVAEVVGRRLLEIDAELRGVAV